MVAVAVAAAATVATVASTAMKAGMGGGAGSSAPGVAPPGQRETRARAGQEGGLDAASAAAGAAGASGAAINPYLYQLAGVNASYDPASQAAAKAAQGNVSSSQDALTQAEQASEKYAGKYTGAKGGRKAFQKGRQSSNQALKQAHFNYQQAQAAAQRASSAATTPTSLTGTGPDGRPGIGDPNQRKINDLLEGRVLNDLTTGYSNDPTLERQIKEQGDTLNATLRQQLGPDYATSSQGMQALANFNQRSAELRTNFARQDILQMYPLETQAQASEVDTAAGQARMLLTPMNTDLSISEAYGNVAGGYGNLAASLQGGRIGEAEAKAAQQRAATEQFIAQQQYGPAAALGNLGSGLGTAAYGLATAGKSGAPAAPATTNNYYAAPSGPGGGQDFNYPVDPSQGNYRYSPYAPSMIP